MSTEKKNPFQIAKIICFKLLCNIINVTNVKKNNYFKTYTTDFKKEIIQI